MPSWVQSSHLHLIGNAIFVSIFLEDNDLVQSTYWCIALELFLMQKVWNLLQLFRIFCRFILMRNDHSGISCDRRLSGRFWRSLYTLCILICYLVNSLTLYIRGPITSMAYVACHILSRVWTFEHKLKLQLANSDYCWSQATFGFPVLVSLFRTGLAGFTSWLGFQCGLGCNVVWGVMRYQHWSLVCMSPFLNFFISTLNVCIAFFTIHL